MCMCTIANLSPNKDRENTREHTNSRNVRCGGREKERIRMVRRVTMKESERRKIGCICVRPDSFTRV